MSGGYVPYSFRQNKAVDRHLFIELLNRLQALINVREYRYVGFGGPFLEDMKLMHAHFGITNLISLEADERVLRRQEFNRPLSCVKLLGANSKDFLDSDAFASRTILWLDYASPKQLRQQLEEIQMTCGKMARGDVLRVTLNANFASHFFVPEATAADRAAAYKAKVGKDYFPAALEEDSFDTASRFSTILIRTVERAVKRGCSGTQTVFQPLSIYEYSDGPHAMLTVTGILLEDGERDSFLERSGLLDWEFSTTSWPAADAGPTQIRIPDLSIRERLYLDTHLPNLRTSKRAAKKVLRQIGPALAAREDQEQASLEQYAQFYRHFPYLSRIIL